MSTNLPDYLKAIVEEKNMILGPPEGFTIIRGKIPSIVTKKAVEILNQIKPPHAEWYGYQEEYSDGENIYLAKVEPHFDNHPKKGEGPPFWHIGVSTYVMTAEYLEQRNQQENTENDS